MSDTSTADRDSAAGPLAGERLAQARRDQDIAIKEIAKELHLDEHKVQALEQNQFDVLGAPVFAKGHLRKYAAIVNVPIDDILTDYYQLNRSVGAPPVVGAPRKTQRDIDLAKYLLPGAVVLLAVILISWWLASGSPLPSFGGDEAPEGEITLPTSTPIRPPSTVPLNESAEDDGDSEQPQARLPGDSTRLTTDAR